jgi:hypothetical protein
MVGTPPPRGVYVGQLDGSAPKRLLDPDSTPKYVSGHLLFVRQETLFAQAFDPVGLVLSGNPFRVAEQVTPVPDFPAAVSASSTGTSFAVGRREDCCHRGSLPGSIGRATGWFRSVILNRASDVQRFHPMAARSSCREGSRRRSDCSRSTAPSGRASQTNWLAKCGCTRSGLRMAIASSSARVQRTVGISTRSRHRAAARDYSWRRRLARLVCSHWTGRSTAGSSSIGSKRIQTRVLTSGRCQSSGSALSLPESRSPLRSSKPPSTITTRSSLPMAILPPVQLFTARAGGS